MSLDRVKVHLVDSVDEAQKLMTWLGQTRYRNTLGVDTETTGLNTRTDRLRLVQVGDSQTGWSIPWERWGGVFEEVVRKWDGDFVFHNATFDLAFTDREGIVIPRSRVHDTWPMSHILNPIFSTALKNQAAKFVDPRAAAMQQELDAAIGAKGGWTWETVPITHQLYWTYGALDPVLTAQLFEHHVEAIEADGSWGAYELECGVQWVLAKMQLYGIHVDRQMASIKQQELVKYCEEVAQWVKSKYGISPGSNQDIINVLREEGFDFTKTTKGGAASLDKEVLESIDHPLAVAVLQRRQFQKIASTYLSHFASEADEDDILHPSINPLGARTSRMSMSNPNLQNLPRQSDHNQAGNLVRNCITSRYDEPGTMMFCDFSQIEMRGLAHMSGDAGLKAAFIADEDFFVNLAKQVFRDDGITKKDPRRQIVKNVGYGKIYGAGIPKLAITAGISHEQAAAAMHAFDSSFPGVRTFQNLIQRTAIDRKAAEGVGYVRSPLTRRRHPSDDGKEYALVNYLIQGLAAEVFKMKIMELDAAGLSDFMCIPVHDEIILDVPGDNVREVAQILGKVMNDESLLSVPIEAEISVGQRWGSKQSFSPS